MKKILLSFVLISFFTILLYADSAEFLRIVVGESAFTASSTLIEKDKPEDYYGADKAFDEDSGTSWCEGKKGDGIGESVTVQFKKIPWAESEDAAEIVGIRVLNGFGKQKHLYLNNNRVKDFRLTFYQKNGTDKVITSTFGSDLCGKDLGNMSTIDEYCKDTVSDYSTNIKEFNECIAKKKQECIMDEKNGGQNILLKKPLLVTKVKLEILSVYKGEKFSDTCISGIDLLQYNTDFGTYEKYKGKKY